MKMTCTHNIHNKAIQLPFWKKNDAEKNATKTIIKNENDDTIQSDDDEDNNVSMTSLPTSNYIRAPVMPTRTTLLSSRSTEVMNHHHQQYHLELRKDLVTTSSNVDSNLLYQPMTNNDDDNDDRYQQKRTIPKSDLNTNLISNYWNTANNDIDNDGDDIDDERTIQSV
jgi:hypothetical protein